MYLQFAALYCICCIEVINFSLFPFLFFLFLFSFFQFFLAVGPGSPAPWLRHCYKFVTVDEFMFLKLVGESCSFQYVKIAIDFTGVNYVTRAQFTSYSFAFFAEAKLKCLLQKQMCGGRRKIRTKTESTEFSIKEWQM